jgi:hypothetical protein
VCVFVWFVPLLYHTIYARHQLKFSVSMSAVLVGRRIEREISRAFGFRYEVCFYSAAWASAAQKCEKFQLVTGFSQLVTPVAMA